MAYGSLPGAYWTASAAVPRLPAAATTTIPCSQADSTAASSGSLLYDWGVSEDSDRLTTRMLYWALCSTTNCRALMTSSSVARSVSSAALTAIQARLGRDPEVLAAER